MIRAIPESAVIVIVVRALHSRVIIPEALKRNDDDVELLPDADLVERG